MSSAKTAAAAGKIGVVRRDPMAMLPFCGYHMADYFEHWLKIGAKSSEENLPKIFYVNWFRKSEDGRWLWPGFGENSRVLKWVFERVSGRGEAVETPIGDMPTPEAIDCDGLDISGEDMAELLRVDRKGWLDELPGIDEHYAQFGGRLPAALREELASLKERLEKA
jgi:phosphoenolpyruvate carboxykinase (GTP)